MGLGNLFKSKKTKLFEESEEKISALLSKFPVRISENLNNGMMQNVHNTCKREVVELLNEFNSIPNADAKKLSIDSLQERAGKHFLGLYEQILNWLEQKEREFEYVPKLINLFENKVSRYSRYQRRLLGDTRPRPLLNAEKLIETLNSVRQEREIRIYQAFSEGINLSRDYINNHNKEGSVDFDKPFPHHELTEVYENARRLVENRQDFAGLFTNDNQLKLGLIPGLVYLYLSTANQYAINWVKDEADKTKLSSVHDGVPAPLSKKLAKIKAMMLREVEPVFEVVKSNLSINQNVLSLALQKYDTYIAEELLPNVSNVFYNSVCVRKIVDGYEKGDQKLIHDAAFILKPHKAYGDPEILVDKIADRKTWVHGISAYPVGTDGSWASTRNARGDFWITPEEYVERVVSVINNGLIASDREDSSFSNPSLRNLKEVFLFEFSGKHADGSRYGPVSVTFETQGKYAVFLGKKYMASEQEYFILTKDPIKEKFKVMVTNKWDNTRIRKMLVNARGERTGRELFASDYVRIVRNKLKELGLLES